MFLNILLGILIILIILSPFLIQLSIFSLKYYAASYLITPQNLELFLNRLPTIFRVFYSRNLKGIYFKDNEHTPQQIAASLGSQRILTAVLPCLFIVAGLIGIFQALSKHDIAFMVGNLMLIFCLLVVIRSAWHFGYRLKDVQPFSNNL